MHPTGFLPTDTDYHMISDHGANMFRPYEHFPHDARRPAGTSALSFDNNLVPSPGHRSTMLAAAGTLGKRRSTGGLLLAASSHTQQKGLGWEGEYSSFLNSYIAFLATVPHMWAGNFYRNNQHLRPCPHSQHARTGMIPSTPRPCSVG